MRAEAVGELESGDSVDVPSSMEEVETRLVAAAKRHHLEERNIAYWLLEIEERGWRRERGFSSIGDYALELIGIKPRKAQYLVFIASRLEKLPRVQEAFDSGELSWTKAREITSVATAETESEWLDKAGRLSNRDLERAVRRHAGQGSGGYATVTISMPSEVLEMWNEAYELAERMSGTELEKWQVLEPTLAEFLGTHLPGDVSGGEVELEDEKALPEAVRNAVLERDEWRCAFPGCTMRKMLDIHHIVFRSHGGSDEPANLVCLCRTHHGLVHRGICKITGSVGVDLEFERPRLVTEAAPSPEQVVAEPEPRVEDHEKDGDQSDPDERWRDEAVARILTALPRRNTSLRSKTTATSSPIGPRRREHASWRTAHAYAAEERGRAHTCAPTWTTSTGGPSSVEANHPAVICYKYRRMTFESGSRLAHYEIVEPIGAGGMGEVYRARDTKLGRDVAIKVLPEEFSKDEERMARFEREARVLASLNHPNIASIYGFESGALVLELVEGPTLAERIQGSAIPVDETIGIAKQIVDALEAGHEAGVIHRDLKPANIKLKEDGTVKVLDYGLAKAFDGESADGVDSELSQSPTLTRPGHASRRHSRNRCVHESGAGEGQARRQTRGRLRVRSRALRNVGGA